MRTETKLPICVDCDGTLIRTDLLHEAVFLLLKKSFIYVFLLPLWLMRGKAHMKEQIALRVTPDPSLLPYNEDLVRYLRTAKEEGHTLLLATASPIAWATKLANYLGFFDRVEATRNGINLSAENKARRLCEIYGEKGFIYAGNSRDDLPIWSRSAGAIVVEAPRSVIKKVEKLGPVITRYTNPKPKLGLYLKAIRLHQWLKNLLVFVPALASHRIFDESVLLQSFTAFIAYGLCASSVYLLNDLLDLPSDRAHPRKRERPFASGLIQVKVGAYGSIILLVIAILLSLLLPHEFVLVLCGYYLTTLAYSLWLKNKVILDVLTLATLYTFRIIAGAAALSIVPSFWLLAFSIFLFLSLALVKRYAELQVVLSQNKLMTVGRGYHVDDMPLLMSLGGASGYLAVLVMALYVNSDDVHALYASPQVLWLMLPLILYWISRVWMKTHRGQMHDDPVVFAVKDRLSFMTAVVCVAVLLAATKDWKTFF